jgi:hypothetical protein
MTKQLVKRYVRELEMYSIFDGNTIDEVVLNLAAIKEQYPDSNITFDVHNAGYDDGTEVYLIEERLETDAEYKVRLQVEKKEKAITKKNKAKQEEKDRKEYERLKKKFEGT